MKTVSIIFSISLLVDSLQCFPYPIPEPNQTMEEASEMVMKKFAERSKNYTPRWRDTAFPQLVSYTTLDHSPTLRMAYPEEEREILMESDLAWLAEEWGWLVTVVMAYDLSQTETYFVRKNGEVKLLWHTD